MSAVSPSSARMSVFVGENFACIRIAGRANFTSSIDFKTLISELRSRGFGYFVIDLSQCSLMDSTFLGVLAGFGLKMNEPQRSPADRIIELFNPNSRVAELLENLGVLHLFKVTEGPIDLGGAAPAEFPCQTDLSREDLLRACVEAHQTLMNINPENAAKFRDVSQFLATDLRKLNKP